MSYRLNLLFLLLLSSCIQAEDSRLFHSKNTPLSGEMADFSAQDLCTVADETQRYLKKGNDYDAHANHIGALQSLGITLDQVHKTLTFICNIQKEDTKAKRPSRLHNLNFIQQHFKQIRWMPNTQQAKKFQQQKTLLKNLPSDKILLTKYYIKKAQGAKKASEQFPFALYALPEDEKNLTLEQAEKQKNTLTRYRFIKKDILEGALDKKPLAKAQVYLSRSDLEDSLMQGTVVVNLSENRQETYNVHRNNGHAYDRNLKKEQQKRYWYFKKTTGIMGYGKDANHKIIIKPLVTVAGDLAYFGLGKLLLLSASYPSGTEHRLVILADTGGAFEDNRYQLDLLSGFYRNFSDYHQVWKSTPDYVEARFLILNSP